MTNAYDIIQVQKRWLPINIGYHNETPRGRNSRGFLSLYRLNRVFRLVAVLILSIEPFAYVICNYTCQYRKNKRDNFTHWISPLPTGKSHSLFIISNLSYFVNLKHNNYNSAELSKKIVRLFYFLTITVRILYGKN